MKKIKVEKTFYYCDDCDHFKTGILTTRAKRKKLVDRLTYCTKENRILMDFSLDNAGKFVGYNIPSWCPLEDAE